MSIHISPLLNLEVKRVGSTYMLSMSLTQYQTHGKRILIKIIFFLPIELYHQLESSGSMAIQCQSLLELHPQMHGVD